jgi:hypothetical protein
MDREPAAPTVNVYMEPITGKKTVDIVKGYAKTRGVAPGSLFN